MATPERLDALAGLVGEPPDQIARTLHDELSRALRDIDGGLARHDRPAVRRAMHAARNSALMLDDASLLDALRALDDAVVRDDDLTTRRARGELGGLWARLADELNAAG